MIGQLSEPPSSSNICFPAGTLIKTNQGEIPIELLDSSVHTIRNKRIVGVTETVSDSSFLVCFEKDSIGNNVPSRRTVMTKQHMVFYDGKMTPAGMFLNRAGVHKVKYDGDVLYNVLLEEEGKMLVNNLICETLHPEHPIAKLYLLLKPCSAEVKSKLLKAYNDHVSKSKPVKKMRSAL